MRTSADRPGPRGERLDLLVYSPKPDSYGERIAQAFPDVAPRIADTHDALRRGLETADILLAGRFPAELLKEARRLRWLQVTNAGVDFLSGAALDPALLVTNARGVHAQLMADYAMTVIGMLRWRLARLLDQQRARRWEQVPVAPLSRSTLFLVGLGAIGGAIARRAKAAGMRVLAVSNSGIDRAGVADRTGRLEDLDSFLPEADFVVLVVPSTYRTRGLFDRARLDRMKPSAFLINMARGDVVDEEALLEALEAGVIAGGVSDVFRTEPLPADNPLWTAPNFIVTPHVSGFLPDYEELVFAIFAENLRAFRAGLPLTNRVDPAAGY
ncbi:D-2-hydroxyacid dehydrogenase [Bosea sp. (in: a-proteobacteria)]|uniref:D-2-hydroxyacid dehydrogenase n=1 Tax=Bosea sp. (in: a-proteobacteria) TaxID=1871050 RepID=UPI0026184935|nr:D-2-hydroxyacid dehydrogenase [Bosea sp. (in: a-proteobacteria)]MCO5089489.1 D-2-hydroxyacid dehydrogenase [Bosea sp. (in: a-proteobacteria)]